MLATRACDLCQHVWMDAKAEALLNEARAAGQQRTLRRGSGDSLRVPKVVEALKRAHPRAVVHTLPNAADKPLLTIAKKIEC